MNKKSLLTIFGILLVFIFAFIAYKKIPSGIQSEIVPETTSPTRSAEINGVVVSIEGNVLVINNEVGRKVLTIDEQAKRREEMQKLSPEERQLARQKELEGVTYEKVEFSIPVGVPVVKGTGDASGNSLPAELAEIKKDSYVSIWLNSSNAPEYVKIKGVN